VEGKRGAKVSIIIPALIDKSQHAASMVQGLKLRDGSTVFKSVECRGSRCFTSYRGAVAIFASKAYSSETEQHYEWFGAYSEQADKKKAVKLDGEQASYYRAWSVYTSAWSYRLVGFVKLTGVIKSSELVIGGAKMRALHKRATDFRGAWIYPDPPATYLEVEPLHELTAADGPKFSEVCYGCTVAKPPHNPTACHVNWQTVCMQSDQIPAHVKKEIRPWQK
jgi:hypothetical protein